MPNTPNWTGAFSLDTTYNQYDLVSYQGSTWLSNVDSNMGNVPGQSSQWIIFAQAGQNGINSWQGTWQSQVNYTAFQGVIYNGTSYISLVNINQNNVPSSNPSFWAVLAEGGGQGPAGSFTFTGVWSSSVTYALNDIVSYLGSSYVVSGTPTLGVNPVTDSANWSLIASVGAQGATGPQGPQGIIGLGLSWKGTWSSVTAYHVNDIVALIGNSYIAVQANTGVNPSTDTGTNWQVAARGATAPLTLTNLGGVALSIPAGQLLDSTGAAGTDGQVLSSTNSGVLWVAQSGGGAVASVFGRTGTVAATTGDYTVSQVTGAAPLASPALTGVPTAPTADNGTNTTQIATTAFVLANGGGVPVVQSVEGVSGTTTIDYNLGNVVFMYTDTNTTISVINTPTDEDASFYLYITAGFEQFMIDWDSDIFSNTDTVNIPAGFTAHWAFYSHENGVWNQSAEIFPINNSNGVNFTAPAGGSYPVIRVTDSGEDTLSSLNADGSANFPGLTIGTNGGNAILATTQVNTQGPLWVEGSLLDNTGTAGMAGQVLTSTGSLAAWETLGGLNNLAYLTTGSAPQVPAIVQQAGVGSADSTHNSLSLSLNSPLTAGNSVVLVVVLGPDAVGSSTPTISDNGTSGGNHYGSPIVTEVDDGTFTHFQALFYLLDDAVAASAITMSLSRNGQMAMYAYEVSGGDLNFNASGFGHFFNGGAPSSASTVSGLSDSTAANQLAIQFLVTGFPVSSGDTVVAVFNGAWTVDTNPTILQADNTTHGQMAMAHQLVSTSGTALNSGTTFEAVTAWLNITALFDISPSQGPASFQTITSNYVDDSIEVTANKDVANGYAGLDGSGKVRAANLPTVTSAIQFAIDGGGAVPSLGAKGQISIPYNCTVHGWVLTADQSGSAVVDVLRSTFSAFPSVSSITGSDIPTLASSQKANNLAISAWGSTALNAGDELQVSLTSVVTCSRLNLTLIISIP